MRGTATATPAAYCDYREEYTRQLDHDVLRSSSRHAVAASRIRHLIENSLWHRSRSKLLLRLLPERHAKYAALWYLSHQTFIKVPSLTSQASLPLRGAAKQGQKAASSSSPIIIRLSFRASSTRSFDLRQLLFRIDRDCA